MSRGKNFANYEHGHTWQVNGAFPRTLSFGSALAYSNTYTATVNISADIVSAAVGFSIAKQETVTVGTTYPVPNDGKIHALQAGTIDTRVSFEIHNFCQDKDLGKVGEGTAVETGSIITRDFVLKNGLESSVPQGGR